MKSHYLLLFLFFSCTFSSKAENEDAFKFSHTPTEMRSRFAMLDDVRILANGLLQLGHGLKDFVHKTKGQINEIFNKLNIFDRSFYDLSLQTNEIKVEEEQLKRTTTILQANNQEIKNMSLQIYSKINEIQNDRGHLETKLGGLEEKLNGLTHSLPQASELKEMSSLKNVIDSQNKNIQDLLKVVGEQHNQLDHQKNQIKDLEEKLGYGVLYENAEKSFSSKQGDEPRTMQYLPNNTTNKTSENTGLPADCSDIYNRGVKTSGVYPIKPNQSEPFNVYCEMTEEAGWTVIQHRTDGSVDFDQPWEKYEHGFGDLEREFWLGLEKIYSISQQRPFILHIDLADWKKEQRFMEYTFTLEGREQDYTLHLSQVAGELPDSMSNHTGMRFSTKDRDNDNKEDSNCAENYSGGWWFNACGDTNLNGRYIRARSKGRLDRRRGIYWKPGKGSSYSLMSTKIKIRPRDQESFD
ncbi:Angiopoietin-related protein 3 [Acipenser ruthenus]|uniref:Angiopoietin-related protein 3 n=1 Tax=Acipenser ruthenus TaxID=7906 RepID=A0A662YQK9_ACIRT|nr:Angiopoietin-related protein 3 [Acipenser ruthenus]